MNKNISITNISNKLSVEHVSGHVIRLCLKFNIPYKMLKILLHILVTLSLIQFSVIKFLNGISQRMQKVTDFRVYLYCKVLLKIQHLEDVLKDQELFMHYNKWDHSNLPWLGIHIGLCKNCPKSNAFPWSLL